MKYKLIITSNVDEQKTVNELMLAFLAWAKDLVNAKSIKELDWSWGNDNMSVRILETDEEKDV